MLFETKSVASIQSNGSLGIRAPRVIPSRVDCKQKTYNFVHIYDQYGDVHKGFVDHRWKESYDEDEDEPYNPSTDGKWYVWLDNNTFAIRRGVFTDETIKQWALRVQREREDRENYWRIFPNNLAGKNAGRVDSDFNERTFRASKHAKEARDHAELQSHHDGHTTKGAFGSRR